MYINVYKYKIPTGNIDLIPSTVCSATTFLV